MKTDLYTKCILTVIAACLVWLSITSSPRVVKAQSGAQHIVIDDMAGISTAASAVRGITNYGLPVYLTQPVQTK